MSRLFLVLVLFFLLCSSAVAQLNVVPGGAILPNGALHYIVPTGVPYGHPYLPPGAYQFFGWHPTAPMSWLSYPYVPVPVTYDRPPRMRHTPDNAPVR